MKKTLLLASCLWLFLALGCKKDKPQKDEEAPENYTIAIIKGDNQSDSIGHTLKDSVIIRATVNGQPVTKGKLRFIIEGCGENDKYEEPVFNGNTRYAWQLNGVPGQQKLKIIYIDELGAPRDTITLRASATMPDKGWHPCPCNNYQNQVLSFVKLKSGKLFALPANSPNLLYSDNGGIIWKTLKAAPAYDVIRKITVTPKDELFILTDRNGILYSPDEGLTWDPRNNGIQNFSGISNLHVLPSGKMYAVVPAQVFSSIDNGLHWTLVGGGLTLWGYHNFLQKSNGDIIMLNGDFLYTSSDNGQSFRFLTSMGLTSNTIIFYIDSQDNFYATGFDNQYRMILYRSKDQGENWENVYIVPPDPNMSIQEFSERQGIFYFATAAGLQKTTDFKNYSTVAPELTSTLRTYLLKEDGGMVMGTKTGNLYYYIP